MAYSTPFTAVVGNPIKASDWNTGGRDNILQTPAALATTAGTNNLAPIGANTSASLSQYASVLLSLQSILSQLKGLAQSVDR